MISWFWSLQGDTSLMHDCLETLPVHSACAYIYFSSFSLSNEAKVTSDASIHGYELECWRLISSFVARTRIPALTRLPRDCTQQKQTLHKHFEPLSRNEMKAFRVSFPESMHSLPSPVFMFVWTRRDHHTSEIWLVKMSYVLVCGFTVKTQRAQDRQMECLDIASDDS
jgi:hypothetical protein